MVDCQPIAELVKRIPADTWKILQEIQLGRALGSHRVALHLGEIAQDNRWEKQRSGRMMALHCRSRAGPVRSSLGKRVPQTP